jgi:hypothetical protein
MVAPVHANAAKEWALMPGYQVDFLQIASALYRKLGHHCRKIADCFGLPSGSEAGSRQSALK